MTRGSVMDHPIPMAPCKYCGKQTPMTGTKMCDNCWETTRLGTMPPEVLARIIRGEMPAAQLAKLRSLL